MSSGLIQTPRSTRPLWVKEAAIFREVPKVHLASFRLSMERETSIFLAARKTKLGGSPGAVRPSTDSFESAPAGNCIDRKDGRVSPPPPPSTPPGPPTPVPTGMPPVNACSAQCPIFGKVNTLRDV